MGMVNLNLTGNGKFGTFSYALIIMLIIDTIRKRDVNSERRKKAINALLVLGSMNVAVGMFGQIMGIWFALVAILEAADINMEMVMGGLKASFSTTYFGLSPFFLP